MNPGAAAEAIEIEVHLRADGGAGMARDIRLGLTAKPKELAPKYFYDERGSQLFEQITELREYYPTRAERQILSERSAEIVAAAGEPGTLVELGSGSAAKTRHLLNAMRDAGCLATYVPVDISEEITRQTAEALVEEYPGLIVRGLVCDFEHDLERIPNGGGGRLVAFLGGTIGNLYPDARRDFLARIAALLEPGDRILLGTDLVKAHDRLELAYDDPGGVTAEFNKNVLQVLNREFDADFDLDRFEHIARYDSEATRMDIRLRSLADQTVRLDGLDLTVRFEAGEEMRTEISTKFTREALDDIYREAGLRPDGWFTDAAEDYALSLASV
ncbi:MAG TPA: L-histidine N(alpha)-methyltransferase [Solirubrobacterales bacterium]|nr:L-histidine N(alpha)-methyltransferase [Solirubrobacterales bacterium]